MSQTLEPEEVHRLLGRFFQTVDAIVVSFGGSVDKHIGDAVMAVFGAPIAHGDEAVRALRAAVEIQRAVPALGTELACQLRVHIGIAAGEVVASGLGSDQHHPYTVVGRSVNLAARLVDIAQSGETVVDEAVHHAAGNEFRGTAIENLHLKGIESPIRAWRVDGLAQLDAADNRRPFVGRRDELALLAAALERARVGGGVAIQVRGEAGMGKSRLVAELRRLACEGGFACHTGLALDFGMGKDRGAVRDIVAGLLGIAPGAPEDERHAALAGALMPGRVDPIQRPFLTDLLDLPQPADSRARYEAMDETARQRGRADALVDLLKLHAREQPVLLIVEDVHWADTATLAYLAALTRATSALPAVLAMTSRLEGDPLDAAWRAEVRDARVVTIDLGPLRPEDAQAFAGTGYVGSERFAQRCIERADGNPLFLEQLLATAGDEDDRLPATLHSLVLARVDRLPERDRAALRAAAVVGQRFGLPLVRHLCQLPEVACEGLVAHRLVRPEGDEWMFSHALIRDGVYASLTKARRGALHRTAAAWFAERDPVLHAEHLDRAEAPEAAQAYLQAARAEAAALKQEHAIALARRGAALARERGDAYALNVLLGNLLRYAGAGTPAVEAYRAALVAADGPAERSDALLGIAAGHRLIGGIDEALGALAEAEPLVREHGLVRQLTELHYTRGNLCFAQGHIDACRSEHQAALAGARTLADTAWEARALSGLADADYAEGRMRTARDHFARCVALCDAHGHARIAIANRAMIGHCRVYMAEFDAGLADMQAAGEAARQLGDRHREMFALESVGLLLAACSRYAEARPIHERGLAMAEALGARRYQAVILAHQAEAMLAHGAAADARERLRVALPMAREAGFKFYGPAILGLVACAAVAAEERERCFAEAEATLAAGCMSHNYFFFYRVAIDDAMGRGEWPRALRYAAALADYTRAEPLPYSEFLVARAGTIAALAQRPEDTALRKELARLQAEAERLRWPIAWPEWASAGGSPPHAGALPR